MERLVFSCLGRACLLLLCMVVPQAFVPGAVPGLATWSCLVWWYVERAA